MLETDAAPLSRAFLEKMSEIYSVNADWLLHGHGEVLRSPSATGNSWGHSGVETVLPSRPNSGDVRFNGVEYVFARRMALSAASPNGLKAIEGGDAEGMAFPSAWLRRQGINSDLAVLVMVTGDSMSPAIPDGALVLIHVAERSPATPGIYALTFDEHSVVRRIMPQSTGPDGRARALAVFADNPAYQPEVLSGQDLGRITVVGRVRAVIAQV